MRSCRHISGIPSGGTMMVPSDTCFRAAQRAMVSAEAWTGGVADFPSFIDRATDLRFSLGGTAGDGSFDPKTDRGFAADLATLDPLVSVVFMLIMAAWMNAFNTDQLMPCGGILMHVNHILDVRDLRRKKRDYVPEQKRAISRIMRQLGLLRVRGEHELQNKKRLRLTGPLLEIVEAEAQGVLGCSAYGFIVRPGIAARGLLTENPPMALFFRNLAQLSVCKPGVERAAYLIGLYLVHQFRIRESHGNYDQPFRIQKLLEGAVISVPRDSRRYTRFKEQVEGAFDVLCEIGVIRQWEYAVGDEDGLPTTGWFQPWLKKGRFVVTPPDEVLLQSQRRIEARKLRKRAASRSRRSPTPT